MPELDISPKDLHTVLNILQTHASEYEIWAFGSRVTRTARKFSDLDLVIKADKPPNPVQLIKLKDSFSESDIPFRVDIIDWSSLTTDFKKIILKNYLVLQKSGS